MTFSQALEEMKAGARVGRQGWDTDSFMDIKQLNQSTSVDGEELLADDWEILPPAEPTIEELRRAIVALAEDAKVARGLLNETLIHTEKLWRSGD